MMASLLPEGAIRALRDAVRQRAVEVHERLGPYATDKEASWRGLTLFIDTSVLDRAGCTAGRKIVPGDVRAADEPSPYSPESIKFAPNPQVPVPEEEQTYTPSFAPLYEAGREQQRALQSTPGTLTMCSLDRSNLVVELTASYYGGEKKAVLGELQLAFILFLLLHSLPALEHWKRLLHTLSTCGDLMKSDPLWTCALLRVIHGQLLHVPQDFFECELSADNFLRQVLTCLFQSLDCEDAGEEVHEHRLRLLVFVKKRFDLFAQGDEEVRFGCEDDFTFNLVDEDQPVIVVTASSDDHVGEDGSTRRENSAVDVSRGDFDARRISLDNILSSVERPGSTVDSPSHAVLTFPRSPDGDTLMSHTAAVSPSPPTKTEAPDSHATLEMAQFGWRYPALCDALHRGEDLVMCCARLLQEERVAGGDSGAAAGTAGASGAAMREARLFLNHEIARSP